MIVHADEVNRPAGALVMRHVVPTKFEPDAVTGVPTGPDIGSSVIVGVPRLNQALPASPVFPVTYTKYVPDAPDATVKVPDIVPPARAHTGFAIRPVGYEEIVQLVSPAAKPEPRTITTVPGDPEAGVRLMAGVTRKLAVFQSPIGSPVTLTGYEPSMKLALEFTWIVPVTVPPVIAQLYDPTTCPVILQLVSRRLKPVPVTFTIEPRGP